MFELDHIAIQTDDIEAGVEFYVQKFNAHVLYADATWAFMKVGQGKVALVTPAQHPAHIALRVDQSTLDTMAAHAGKPIDRHRDGTIGIYVNDPSGNVVELICYPPGETVYGKSATEVSEAGSI